MLARTADRRCRLPGTVAIGQRVIQYRVAMTLEVGTRAPDFTLPNQGGEPTALASFRGKRVVLYFYPKADTPGCTVQACAVRDHRQDWADAGAVVLGVSPDAPKKIAKFDDKHELGFTLLGDEDHTVAEAYGVWVEKSMYGRTYMGMERSTFLIDTGGVITHIFRKVKPAEHDAKVLAALAE